MRCGAGSTTCSSSRRWWTSGARSSIQQRFKTDLAHGEGPSAPLPLGGGLIMIGRTKNPETEIGIINVRLRQIGIRGRIWTYLAKGYNATTL